MKHAGAGALDALHDLLMNLRARTDLVERRPEIFYVKSRAFLHFHQDRTGLFADLRDGREWRRLPVNDPGERANLLSAVGRTIREESTTLH